jgi:CIC family chloride channel protein
MSMTMTMTPKDHPSDAAVTAKRALLFMSLLAVATGLIAGTGAWAFRRMIGFVHNGLFLGDFSFYYDANAHTPASP